MSWNHQITCFHLTPLHPQRVDHPEQEMSGVIFQPSYYPQHVFGDMTIFPIA